MLIIIRFDKMQRKFITCRGGLELGPDQKFGLKYSELFIFIELGISNWGEIACCNSTNLKDRKDLPTLDATLQFRASMEEIASYRSTEI